MGVPQFFHWLTTHYEKHLLFDNYPYNVPPEYLYLDFNCAIHPAVKRPELVGKESFDTLDEMYDAVCQYLDKILKAVKPTKMVYIAVDGVAPLAKMKQQRVRRFKAVQDRRELDRIDTKHKCFKPSKFDYNMISPGTEFMEGLTQRVRQHIANQIQVKSPGLQIIFDDASNCCEGEHKIMHHIRTHVGAESPVVVYGLDSDLIFLCLIHYRPKFCLFREKIFFDGKGDKGDEYTYFDISTFRKILLSIMNPGLSHEELVNWGIMNSNKQRALDNAKMLDIDHFNRNQDDNYEASAMDKNDKFDLNQFRIDLQLDPETEYQLIMDYVSLCFILGNDFLPYVPSLKIKEGGLNRAMECYKHVQGEYSGEYLVDQRNPMNYNLKFLTRLFERISDYEEIDLQKQTEASETRRSKFKNGMRLRGLTPYERDKKIWEYIENKYKDVLKMGEDGWKERYYQHYLGQEYSDLQNKMIENYLTGLYWVLRYYQGNQAENVVETCPDWNWKYYYLIAPPASCLAEYLKNHPDFEIKLETHEPVIPAEQLMLILPPQSSDLVLPKLAKLMTNIDSPLFTQYPTNFEIDMIRHCYRWECYPIIPPVDLELTKKVVRLILNTDQRENPKRRKKILFKKREKSREIIER